MLSNNYEIMPNCKYRLPCGWCDRKNEVCSQVNPQQYFPNITYAYGEVASKPPGIPDACKQCSSHPSNGGSGLCTCSLAYPEITSNTLYGSNTLNDLNNKINDDLTKGEINNA